MIRQIAGCSPHALVRAALVPTGHALDCNASSSSRQEKTAGVVAVEVAATEGV